MRDIGGQLPTGRWIEGRNVQFEVRWAAGGAEEYRRYAPEERSVRLDDLIRALLMSND